MDVNKTHYSNHVTINMTNYYAVYLNLYSNTCQLYLTETAK